MTKFLVYYFTIYGGTHLYFFRKICLGLNPSRRLRIILSVALLVLFAAPIAARVMDASGFIVEAEFLSRSGYLWMGLLFLFFTAALLLDIINFIHLRVASLLFRRNVRMIIRPGLLLGMATIYSTVIGIYGWNEATNVRIEHLEIISSKIPAKVGRIRIVQISDLHVGQIVREERINSVIKKIITLSPDVLVSTGDLVDGHQDHLNGLDRLFREVSPRFGKYAILGNHEHYVGVATAIAFIQRAGFTVLNNETRSIGNHIMIIGIDDSRDETERLANDRLESQLLSAAGADNFRLLLKHRPLLARESAGKSDLQLSGHVHKGQIFPFNLLVWLNFRIKSGLTKVMPNQLMYVSRGTGVWGPPIRFLAPPEITVIDLKSHSSFQ